MSPSCSVKVQSNTYAKLKEIREREGIPHSVTIERSVADRHKAYQKRWARETKKGGR